DRARQLLAGPVAGWGKGGPGREGGEGTGVGTGKGSGSGPGEGSIQEKRQRRWRIRFTPLDSGDYAAQLSSLGVILVAEGSSPGEYIVYRDLMTRPVKGKIEDLRANARRWD